MRRIAAWPGLFTAGAIALVLGGLLEANLWPPSAVDSDTFKVLSLTATLPILLSRRYLAVSAIVVGGTTITLLTMSEWAAVCVLIGQYWIIYEVAARTTRVLAGVALLPLIGNAIHPYTGSDATLPSILILVGGLLVAAIGDSVRQAKRAIAERNAAREETAQARHDRAVLAERSRIARELHDVVAHHVSMMVLQAETARVSTPGLGEEGGKSFEAIRDTGRQALTEMRRVVGMLRRDPDPGEPMPPTDRSPQPSLDQLDDLISAARVAGTRVTLQRDIRPPALSAMVELSGYRIIQEALTNVRRHAPGASAEVIVRYSQDALHIQVTDDGPAPSPAAPQGHPEGQRQGGPGGQSQGHGLVGMRERAATVGGLLRAGPRATGGFFVEAALPVHGAPRGQEAHKQQQQQQQQRQQPRPQSNTSIS